MRWIVYSAESPEDPVYDGPSMDRAFRVAHDVAYEGEEAEIWNDDGEVEQLHTIVTP